MTETVQSVPQVLLDPFAAGPVLTPLEAAALAAALTPCTRTALKEAGFGDTLVDSMVERGLLAGAPAEAGLWHRHGWGRPRALLHAAATHRARRAAETPTDHATTTTPVLGPVSGVLDGRAAFDRALARRSVRRFDRRPMPAPVLYTVLAATVPLLEAWPHLRLYAAVQDVEGIERGVHTHRAGALDLRSAGLDDARLRACAHQYWVLGTGAVLFLTVSWPALEAAYGRGPDAYTRVLGECGRVAHTAVLAAARAGAGTWMTPALDEETAAGLCGLDTRVEEALYMLKTGMPRNTTTMEDMR
ncbi:hypothetical protein GCM10010232_70420 [Streptomyces amakusaensis]|uniref:Nitroreductase family protein n=1 Tax=Streptomyces amakusaensis TaxID=67271 RepID=A0ABW0ATF3_9ACTN